jgi:hypothetical protein
MLGNRGAYHQHGVRYQTPAVYLRDSSPRRTFLSIGTVCPYCGFTPNKRYQRVQEAAQEADRTPKRGRNLPTFVTKALGRLPASGRLASQPTDTSDSR